MAYNRYYSRTYRNAYPKASTPAAVSTPASNRLEITSRAVVDVRGRRYYKAKSTDAADSRKYIVYGLGDGLAIGTRVANKKWNITFDGTVFVTESEAESDSSVTTTPIAIAPVPVAEKKTFSCELSRCRFSDWAISVSDPETGRSYQISKFDKRFHLDFPFSKLLEKVKKALRGSIEVSIEVTYRGHYSNVWSVVGVSIADETLARLKTLHTTYVVNLELKRLIRAAKRQKSFFQKQALRQKLLAKHGGDEALVDALVEKHFNRDKYDYRCFESLKTVCGDESIYMTDTQFVFVINSPMGVPWYIVETPGKTSATYVFDDTLPLEELLGALWITPKSCIIADEKVQKHMGFKCRLIHRNFGGWLSHVRMIAREYDIAQFLQSDMVVRFLEDEKKKESTEKGVRRG